MLGGDIGVRDGVPEMDPAGDGLSTAMLLDGLTYWTEVAVIRAPPPGPEVGTKRSASPLPVPLPLKLLPVPGPGIGDRTVVW